MIKRGSAQELENRVGRQGIKVKFIYIYISSKLPEGPAFPLTSLPRNKVQDPVTGLEGHGLVQRE